MYSIHCYLLVIAVVCLQISVDAVLKKSDVRNHLGTRTPYRFKYNKNDTQLKYSGCKDTNVWMIIRHGTRLPSATDITGMNTTLKYLRNNIIWNHKKGRGQLTSEQLEQLEKWSTNINVENEKYLTREGEEEMVLLAERMHKRFPNAVKNKYSNESFLFRYTATQRAQQSARYFTIGLFDKTDTQKVIYSPALKIDPVLRFYKHCDKWQKQVKKNPKTYEAQKLFGNSRQMSETLEYVSQKLGLDRLLSLDEVNLMFKICGFETSWDKHHISPWCHAFEPRDAEMLEYYHDLRLYWLDGYGLKCHINVHPFTNSMLEYYHDLRLYWLDGYGHNLTYKQACLAIKTMFELFKSKKESYATFLFAHSGTLLKILTHMNLYKPKSHLSGNKMDKEREWKASDIDCFASNLAFVLFKCKDGDKVLTLHQERVVTLPMCAEELCPLHELEEYFYDSIYNCDYSDMCSLGKDL